MFSVFSYKMPPHREHLLQEVQKLYRKKFTEYIDIKNAVFDTARILFRIKTYLLFFPISIIFLCYAGFLNLMLLADLVDC